MFSFDEIKNADAEVARSNAGRTWTDSRAHLGAYCI